MPSVVITNIVLLGLSSLDLFCLVKTLEIVSPIASNKAVQPETQYSLSDDAKKLGRPKNFSIKVKEVKVSNGAGFIVVLTGLNIFYLLLLLIKYFTIL